MCVFYTNIELKIANINTRLDYMHHAQHMGYITEIMFKITTKLNILLEGTKLKTLIIGGDVSPPSPPVATPMVLTLSCISLSYLLCDLTFMTVHDALNTPPQ